MAAPMLRSQLASLLGINFPSLCGGQGGFLVKRGVHVTAVCSRRPRTGRVKISRLGDKMVDYEKAQPPHMIQVRKGWTAYNTTNLKDEQGAAVVAVEDMFIRKFIHGTFPACLLSECIIKRRYNTINIACLMNKSLLPEKYYFLIGYSEKLLGYLLQQIIKLEIQFLDSNAVYKWV